MKKIFTLLILALSLSALSFEIKVRKMARDGQLERSFVLTTQLQDKVVLDCQSFIQGLRIGEAERAVYFMLDEEECQSLQGRVKASLRKFQKHCIDVDQDIRADYTCN